MNGICKLQLKLVVLYVILLEFNLTSEQQVIDKSEYLSIDSLITAYEQKNDLRFFYNSEWFKIRKLHMSKIDIHVNLQFSLLNQLQ